VGGVRKPRYFLDELGVEYSYVYVDLLEGEEQESVMNEVRRWNPHCSFPTVVASEQTCIVGYDKQKIKEAIGL